MKTTTISIVIAVLFISGAVFFAKGNGNSDVRGEAVNNVSMVDGKQVIEINAKGGYSPQLTTAKAGVPTVIKVATKGTFDCSSSLTLPKLGFRENLPPSGTTEIEVPAQTAGETIEGICSMGMYNFTVNFI